jgi:molybdenum cofactor cytidylyltransferase
VVLGHQAQHVRDEAGDLDAHVVVNEGYREGRASSLRCGGEAVADGVEAVLVLSVDQPRPAAVLRALVEAWRERRPALALPAYNGHRGHPVLAHGRLLGELRSVNEETLGLRAVTERHREETEVIQIDDPVVNLDLNTPSDYAAAIATYASGETNG